MGSKTKIEWTEATWNPVTGCTPVSEGCKNCYAKRLAERFPHIHDPRGDLKRFSAIHTHEDRLDIPLHWRKPRRIFVCSMGDLFHPDVPGTFIHRVWQTMFNTPRHTYMILTKRPDRLLAWTRKAADGMAWPVEEIWPDWMWLGVTVENQPRADERIPILMQTPAAVRFVSCEPLLGPVDLRGNFWISGCHCGARGVADCNCFPRRGIDWAIAGGETGPGARPMNLDWARSLRDQCQFAGVPFFFKQVGPTKKAGRLLDGRTWDEKPAVRKVER